MLNSELSRKDRFQDTLPVPSTDIFYKLLLLCLTYKENIDVVLRYRSADQGRPWCP